MVTREDVESYLIRTGMEYEEMEPGMWLARSGDDGPGIVISHTPPVLVFRLKVLDVPRDEEKRADLYRRLLEFNATDLLHAAYGLEHRDVILTETLELENLDFNEFQATLDSFQMALAGHLHDLTAYRDC